MEELQTVSIDVPVRGKVFPCQLKERDFGDYIVYDVLVEGDYSFTLSKKGDILFNEGSDAGKLVLDPAELNEIADYLKKKAGLDIE